MRFNLVDDPWITVRNLDGDDELVSLRKLFHAAPRIRRIAGELPTQDFAILRIALAVLYRVAEPRLSRMSIIDLAEELWADGRRLLDSIDAYLDEWQHRFELFDDVHPFMQVPDLATNSGEIKGLELLVPDSPGMGSLFTMRQAVPALNAAAAARWLVHCQAFDFSGIKSGAVGDDRVKGGKGYPIGIGWCGWLGGIIVEGDTLHETLLLNYAPPREVESRDLPLWELPPVSAAARGTDGIGPYGPSGLFTWPIRRIRLFGHGDRVTGVLVCNGDPIDYWLQHHHEPMSGWRLSEPQAKKHKLDVAYMPRAHDPSRSLWRGLAAMLPATGESTDDGHAPSMPSAVVKGVGLLRQNEVIPDNLVRVVAVGVTYGAQNSSYSEIFTDSVVLHPSIAKADGPQLDCVMAGLARADGGVQALSALAGDLAIAAGGNREPAAPAARERGYAALDQQFRQWLPSVSESEDTDAALERWTAVARGVLRTERDALLAAAGPAARGLREKNGRLYSAGLAANWFDINLAKYLPAQLTGEADA
jgi:CRISPR system Cascade subunit CasA